jgi:hypothetical protein
MAIRAGTKLRAGNFGQLSSQAQYTASSTQTINSGSDTVIAFGTADYTSAYVTRNVSGVGHVFLLNVSGLWAVSATLRWSTTGASATGEKACHLEDALAQWHCSSSIPASTTTPVTHQLSFVKYLESGDTITLKGYQSSGGTEDLEYSPVNFYTPRINLGLILAS